MSAEARLKELGIVLPNVPAPVANYLPYRVAGNLLFLAGQGPRRRSGNLLSGKVGADVSVDEAYKRARIGLQLLFAVAQSRSARSTASSTVVKMLCMVNAVPEFKEHLKVRQRDVGPVRRGVRRERPARALRGRHGVAAGPDLGGDRRHLLDR